MAEIQLTFNESNLDTESALYNLYSRLYEGMRSANECTPPDFTDNPPLTEDGEIDFSKINESLKEYSTILMKNSAYLYASSIISVVGSGGGGGGSAEGCILRSGDSMSGPLNALYGLQAGVEGSRILEFGVDINNIKYASVYGDLKVFDGSIQGERFDVGDEGIYFNGNQILYFDDEGIFNIDAEHIKFGGRIEFEEISVGDLVITPEGITLDGNIFYHAGNSNRIDVDWTMQNGIVNNDLTVGGNATISGFFSSCGGFEFILNETKILYTSEVESEEEINELVLNADLRLTMDRSIKLGTSKIISTRYNNSGIVSFSAPGMIMNLGDSDGDLPTSLIALQTGIYNAAGNTRIISEQGDGNFYKSFKAGCGSVGSTALETYFNESVDDDYGVIFRRYARLGSELGPYLTTNDTNTSVDFYLPYTCVDAFNTQINVDLPFWLKLEHTNSQYADQSKSWSASLHFNTEAEFYVFDKQIEAKSFAIDSDQYKTRLIENALFFNDGIFIEGIVDGMLHSGNSYFSGSISSRTFASGFAGYGWAILENETFGGYAATVDELTVRKKMRVYELEVQKMSLTNGSLWVSDSCSGDLVEEIN